MACSIQIDGKEYDVLGMSDDRRGIYTSDGTLWINPVCFGHFGRLVRSPLTGYADQQQLKRGALITADTSLPNPNPTSIQKVTFYKPDTPDCTKPEVSDYYRKNKAVVDEQYAELEACCKAHGQIPESLVDFKKSATKRAKWEKEFGFVENGFIEVSLSQAFENQGVADSAALLASITHAVSYPSGELVYLDSLSDLEPLPKGYKKTPLSKKDLGSRSKGGKVCSVNDPLTKKAIGKEYLRRVDDGQKPTTAARDVLVWANERFDLSLKTYRTIQNYAKKVQKVENRNN